MGMNFPTLASRLGQILRKNGCMCNPLEGERAPPRSRLPSLGLVFYGMMHPLEVRIPAQMTEARHLVFHLASSMLRERSMRGREYARGKHTVAPKPQVSAL